MSTLVAQECYLWLNLTEMKGTEKVRFLMAQSPKAASSVRLLKNYAKQFSAVKKQMDTILPFCGAASKEPRTLRQQTLSTRPRGWPSASSKTPGVFLQAGGAIHPTTGY